MNRLHRWYCRTDHWSRTLEQKILPWALGNVDLGKDVLEVGPGPGCVTEILRHRADRLTSLEIAPKLARQLQVRMANTNVTVLEGDATDMDLEEGRFSGAVSFTMLHHVPTPELQDRLLSEVHRVLQPGGVFVGSDSRTSRSFEWVHAFDTLCPIDPDTFAARLETAGFREVQLGVAPRALRFRAVKA